MGNNITSEIEIEDDTNEEYSSGSDNEDNDFPLQLVEQITQEEISQAIGGILGRIARLPSRTPTNEMPVIRKRPDISTFCQSTLYKEIKALCAYPATSKLPCEDWSLTRGLLRRENGIITNAKAGSFTPNQQRRIHTLFVPNNKEERLYSLEAKVFLSSFNKDGSKLLTACQDSVIRIYDASKGTYHLLNRLRVPDVNWSILDVDFSPCGEFFAYSTWSDYFFVVPLNGGVDKVKWYDLHGPQHRNAVFSLRYSPCGTFLIGGCSHSCVYMCNLETRNIKTIRTKFGFNVDINAVSFINDRDPHLFVTGCNSGTVKLWDTRCVGGGDNNSGESRTHQRRNQAAGVFLGHLDGITYIDSRNDGNYILTNSKDQSIKIWDMRMPTPSNKVNKHPNSSYIEWDYRWDMVPQEYYNPKTPVDGDVSIMTYRGHRVTKSLLRAKFSPLEQTGQRYIYTGCGTGRIIIYDVLTGQIKEAIHGHKDIVRDLGWHPQRSEIVSSSWDSHVNLNTFKPNPLIKRVNSESSTSGTRRRSLRLAHQKNIEMAAENERDAPNEPW